MSATRVAAFFVLADGHAAGANFGQVLVDGFGDVTLEVDVKSVLTKVELEGTKTATLVGLAMTVLLARALGD